MINGCSSASLKVTALSHGLLVVESKNSTLLARYHKVGVVFMRLAIVTYRESEVVFLLVEHAYSRPLDYHLTNDSFLVLDVHHFHLSSNIIAGKACVGGLYMYRRRHIATISYMVVTHHTCMRALCHHHLLPSSLSLISNA